MLILSLALLAQTPDYYSDIDFEQDGTSIRVQLSDLVINTHDTFIPYTSGSIDTWDIIRVSDLEFENSSNVLLIYGHNDIDGMFVSDRTRNKFNTCLIEKWIKKSLPSSYSNVTKIFSFHLNSLIVLPYNP